MSFIRPIGLFVAGATLATALTLTGIQAFNVGAAPGDTDTTYVPIEPCRLLDTRASATQGDRRAPLGAGETYTAQVTGTNGDCVGIPTTASAVALNVTSIGPTAQSFLTVFPGDVTTPPQVSNLNWVAGQPPTPNKVDVKLSPDGKIKLFNAAGTVNIAVDVAGYYTASSLTEIQNRLVALEAEDSALHARISDQKPSTQSIDGSDKTITTSWTNVLQLSAPIIRTGKVIVFASATAFDDTAGHDVQCVISDTPSSVNENRAMLWEASGATANNTAGQGDAAIMSGTRSFSVTGGTDGQFALMCRTVGFTTGATSQIWDPHITVLFIRT